MDSQGEVHALGQLILDSVLEVPLDFKYTEFSNTYTKVFRELQSGRPYRVRVFLVEEPVHIGELLRSLKEERAILVGEEGIDLLLSEGDLDSLPPQKDVVSFGSRDVFWEDYDDPRSLAFSCMSQLKDGEWYANLYYEHYLENCCVLCIT